MKVFIIIIVGVVLGLQIFGNSGGSSPKTHKPELSAEEKASNQRYAAMSMYAEAIKKAARDPSSIEWMEIYSNKNGYLGCFVYRGKNGFNGTTIQRTAVFMGKVAKWKTHCAGKKDLIDMSFMKSRI